MYREQWLEVSQLLWGPSLNQLNFNKNTNAMELWIKRITKVADEIHKDPTLILQFSDLVSLERDKLSEREYEFRNWREMLIEKIAEMRGFKSFVEDHRRQRSE